MKTDKKLNVALAFPGTLAISGNLLNGIFEYARKKRAWGIHRTPEQLSPSSSWLKHWNGDGALTMLTTEQELRQARKLPFPVVNVVGYVFNDKLPMVLHDNRAFGRLQAEHLLERHFKRLVYYGVKDLWYSRERLAGFLSVAHAAGVPVETWMVQSGIHAQTHWVNQQEQLLKNLRNIKPPFAVAASTDMRANMVLEACACIWLRVPEDVAVIGVDNDSTIIPFSNTPLTSIARNDVQLGYQAAELLDKLMQCQKVESLYVPIPPAHLVPRRSTQTIAVEAPDVGKLIQDIQQNIHKPFGVEFLVERSHGSRRSLETRFQHVLGCSPYTIITRLRIDHAKELLRSSDAPKLTYIARTSGFTDLRHFRITFQRITGQSPSAFRKACL